MKKIIQYVKNVINYIINYSKGRIYRGFAKHVIGGRGGENINVSTYQELLNAISGNNPRIIHLMNDIIIPIGGIVVWGQNITIEGYGHWIRGGEFGFKGHDIILNDVYVSVTDNGYKEFNLPKDSLPDDDAFSFGSGCHDIILYRCIGAHSIDESIGMNSCYNITIQQHIAAESLWKSHHKDGSHSMGILLNKDAKNISFINIVSIHNRERNIRVGTGSEVETRGSIFFDFRRPADISPDTKSTFIDNMWLKGPQALASPSMATIYSTGAGVKVYAKGNTNDWGGAEVQNSTNITNLGTPEVLSSGNVKAAEKFYEYIQRNLKNKKYYGSYATYMSSLIDRKGKIINSQTESMLY